MSSKEVTKDSICFLIILAVALYGSIPLFLNSYAPPGYDSAMHYSKVRIFSQLFPSIPQWFPWWYCGTHSLRFYPPLSYLFASSICGLFKTSALAAYQFTDFFSLFLAALFMYYFMRALTGSRFAGVSSAIFYILSPQTLYGRLFVGQFTHNFSVFLIPLTLFCILKCRDNMKRTVLITAPFFSLLFLSHLQTALSFGFMLGIYLFFSLSARWWKMKLEITSVKGLVLGGALGSLLACFWLLPSLLEGSGNLSVSSEAALKAMFPVQSLFLEAENPWDRAVFLGFPLVILSLFALGLVVRRKLDAKKMFWGFIFTSWIAFFLFAIVSPYIGVALGWPLRFAYFIAIPMAMLSSLAVDWIEDYALYSLGGKGFIKQLPIYGLLTLTVLSVFVHTSNVDQFAWKRPYANEIEIAKWLNDQNLKSDERVASFGTFSYTFNVVSDNWQLDGGYIQGAINMDFYYKYWLSLTTVDSVDVILKTLNETNTRYIIFPLGERIPSTYGNQTLFEREALYGFSIYKLKDEYALSFIEVKDGNASVSYSYINPDEMQLNVWDCSEYVTLIVKMNYYPGWALYSSTGEVNLGKNSDGLMKIEIRGAESTNLTIQYGSSLIDQIALGATIAGTTIYLFVLLHKRFSVYLHKNEAHPTRFAK